MPEKNKLEIYIKSGKSNGAMKHSDVGADRGGWSITGGPESHTKVGSIPVANRTKGVRTDLEQSHVLLYLFKIYL